MKRQIYANIFYVYFIKMYVSSTKMPPTYYLKKFQGQILVWNSSYDIYI